MPFQTEAVVEVRRGGRLESEHRGAIAVVGADGRLIAQLGDPELVTYLRSSAKPFQLLPLVESGAADRFGFNDRELAIIAGSHSGEARHIETVQAILKKIGLQEDALQCGAHPPYNVEAAQRLQQAGQAPTPIYNNCSGKHSGLLAAAVDRRLSIDDYLDPNHPIQLSIRQSLADLSGVEFDQIGVGFDGCSAPNFVLPLRGAALAFARLAQGGPGTRAAALARIAQAMMTYPEMVAGEARLDTDLMRATTGRLVSKGGAEGFHGIGVLARDGRSAYGIALKIADGDGKRGGQPVVIEVLRQLGVLTDQDLAALKDYRGWKLTNHRGLEVGDVRANFKLVFA
jgi:L-asparaginase II